MSISFLEPRSFWFFLQEKTSMPIKFLVLGAVFGFLFGWGGGLELGSANFIFVGAGICLT